MVIPAKDGLPLDAALNATAAQLDIAAEDAEGAINQVLDSFDAAASAIEGLEMAMYQAANSDKPEVRPEELLDSVIALRKLLRKAVVELQFQDRLMQRMALASREIRAVAGSGEDNDLFSDGAVPRSAVSLYDKDQLIKISSAAGQETLPDNADGEDEDDGIELF